MNARNGLLLLGAALLAAFLFRGKPHSAPEPARASAPVASTARNAQRETTRYMVKDDGRTLWIVGEIDENFFDRFARQVRALPQLQRIDLSSPGGDTLQALYAGEWIRHAGVAVRAVGECDSACVLLWAAAKQRELVDNATLGLHRGWRKGEDGEQQDVELGEMGVYNAILERAGFGDIDDWVRTTRSDQITALDYSYLMRANIPFSVVNADGKTTWTSGNTEGNWDFSIDKAAKTLRFTP